MAQQQLQRQIKVLRIGILQDRKIVQEKRIRPGESVTIGQSPRATFTYPIRKLPKRFALFPSKGEERYALRFTDAMTGKIAYRDGVYTLEELKRKGYAQRKGDTWLLPLTLKTRGKISIEDITVLFQFVPAPPEPLRPATPTDFRPKLIEQDDQVFLGFLALFFVLGAIFVIYVQNTEVVELVSTEEIPDRFVEIALAPKKKPEEKPKEDLKKEELEGKGQKVVKKEEKAKGEGEAKKEKRAPKTEAERKAEEIRRKQQAEKEVMEKSLLLKMIGTRGESSSGSVVEDLFAQEDSVSGDLDAALQGVSGVEVGTSESLAVKKGTGAGTGREDASIGDLAKASAGSADIKGGPATKVKGKVSTGSADIYGGEQGDQAKVKSVVKRNNGQIQACYEQRLKDNPSLGGRVEISWVIVNGRVTDAKIFSNTTGDDILARCILEKVKRWRFPSDLSEEMEVVYPFILAPG